AKAKLTAQISTWSADRDHVVVLVFDGRAETRIEQAAAPSLELRFASAPGPDAADDVLVEVARPGDTVVTADRGLVGRLAAGVRVVGPTALLAELDHRIGEN
ncbi:MAG: DUF188 domain-containing protein, partial [Actinomycetota bacterium]